MKDIEKVQEKTIGILNFKWKNDLVNSLFKNTKIMIMRDIVIFNNCVFVYDQFNGGLPANFQKFFTTADNQHTYNMRGRKSHAIIKVRLSPPKKFCFICFNEISLKRTNNTFYSIFEISFHSRYSQTCL